MNRLANMLRIHAAILKGVADQLDPQPPRVVVIELPDMEPDQDDDLEDEFPAFFARRTFCQN